MKPNARITDFPDLLKPTATEDFVVGDITISIPKCALTFKPWVGEPINNTFGGKALIDVNGGPVFAELAIVDLFIRSGWQSRWIETYGKGKTTPIMLSNWKDSAYKDQVASPIDDKGVLKCLSGIALANSNSYFGCWDVIGWNGDRIVFVESKRLKRDRIQKTQNSWLAAALKSGLTKDNFLVVWWDFE